MEPIVFVIDDDPAARESTCALLSSSGYRAEGVPTAEDFLAQYNPDQPGCLILDLKMPGMGGMELLRELASRVGGPPLPVVIISAHAERRTPGRRSSSDGSRYPRS